MTDHEPTQADPGVPHDVSASGLASSDRTATKAGASPSRVVRLRLWPAVLLVGLLWPIVLVPAYVAPGSFVHFASMALGPLLISGLLIVWWLLASRAPWLDRFIGLVFVVLVVVGTGAAVHPTMQAGVLFYALPVGVSVLVGALAWTRQVPWPRRRLLVAGATVMTFAAWLLVRSNGMDGSMNTDFAWRWSRTAEDTFLAASSSVRGTPSPGESATWSMPATTSEGDWPAFRGRARDGRLRDVNFATDWSSRPPRERWRRRVGPGWSSFAVVDNFAFTQEQRGDREAVVCYRSDTGEPCWVRETPSRFMESVSGAGPRATPTFDAGQLFTMGGRGTVQCLEAQTGKPVWVRDIMADTGAELPIWGFSSSPLVVDNVVIVFAGGPGGKSVVGYDRASGDIAWTAGEGRMSYSSPHLAPGPDGDQVLMLTELGMEVYEPQTGNVVWRYDWKVQGMRIIQPEWIGEQRLIIGEDYSGCRLLQINRTSSSWSAEEIWTTRSLKPYFNDFVFYQGHCYGFDGKLFTCIDAATGKRCWKGGRYGFGQVLLLDAMRALLVLSEQGEVVLLQANPEKLVELGRFQAIEGKTWNHPVVAHGNLFVRNGEEAACFELLSGERL